MSIHFSSFVSLHEDRLSSSRHETSKGRSSVRSGWIGRPPPLLPQHLFFEIVLVIILFLFFLLPSMRVSVYFSSTASSWFLRDFLSSCLSHPGIVFFALSCFHRSSCFLGFCQFFIQQLQREKEKEKKEGDLTLQSLYYRKELLAETEISVLHFLLCFSSFFSLSSSRRVTNWS